MDMKSQLQFNKKLSISIDDVMISDIIETSLTEITIEHSFQTPSHCNLILVLTKSEYETHVQSFIQRGKINIRVDNEAHDLFSGFIKSISHHYSTDQGFTIQLTASDALNYLAMQHPVRSFVDVTVIDIAEQMLSPYGISVSAMDTGPLWNHLVQYQSSSLEFLQELSERSGLYFYLSNNILNFVQLPAAEATVELEYGLNLLEVACINNHASSGTETVISGWDPQRSQLFMEDSLKSSLDNSYSSNNELPVFQTSIVDQPAQNEQQLIQLRDSQTHRINAMSNYVIGQAEGSIELGPGIDIKLAGLLVSDNEQQYRITKINHSIHPLSGFVTEFSSRPPEITKHSKSTLVTYGVITQITDPENSGKVKVCLPTYNNIETSWIEVLFPGAGENKGIIALPEIDDKVLILMLHERIEQAIVLGGLYGETSLPDEIVVDGKVSRFSMLTPGGQGLRLDDENERISLSNKSESSIELKEETVLIETKSGNAIRMTDDKLLISSNGSFDIEAPGSTLTIRASKINFEKA